MLHVKFCKKGIFLFSIILLALAACAEKGNEVGLSGLESFIVESDDLSNLVDAKNVGNLTEQRAERWIANYEERNAIAFIIAKDQLVDLALMRAMIKNSRNEIIIKNYFDKLTKHTTADAAVQKYYEAHIDEFTNKRAHAAHILISISPDADVNARAEQHKIALKVADELRRNSSFEEVAKQYSDDLETKNKGGDLGWIEAGKADADIVENVMSLNVDEIPQPFLTPRGYHVVKLLEPIEKNVIALDEVKEKIIYKIKYEEKLNELKRLKELAGKEVANLK